MENERIRKEIKNIFLTLPLLILFPVLLVIWFINDKSINQMLNIWYKE